MRLDKNKAYFEEAYRLMKSAKDEATYGRDALKKAEMKIFNLFKENFFNTFKSIVKNQPEVIGIGKNYIFEKAFLINIPRKHRVYLKEMIKNACKKFNQEIIPNCGDVLSTGHDPYELTSSQNNFTNLFKSQSNKADSWAFNIKFFYNDLCLTHMYNLGETIHEKEIMKNTIKIKPNQSKKPSLL